MSSCATKFTPAQRDALSTVMVSSAMTKDKAYQEPDAGDRGAVQSSSMAGVSSGTGAIGGALGSIIGESIAATQDAMYDSKNKQHYSAVKTGSPDVGKMVTSELTGMLREDEFFKSRIRQTSPNQFKAEVINYGLVRATKTKEGVVQMQPQVAVKFSLVDGSGKVLHSHTSVGTGYHHPIDVYAKDRKIMADSYAIAADIAVSHFLLSLGKKTAL